MEPSSEPSEASLPAQIEQLLSNLVKTARDCFKDDLRAIVLFGSGAEGRLRPTSDLNLLFLLRRFDKERVDAFREPLRLAHVAARASAMFILEAELPVAAETFAVKFDDIRRRRRVLYGEDILASVMASRAARKARLRQVLMNLTLRLRERYATNSLREEQLATVVADFAGPLRAAAATLLELEGREVRSPKEALEEIAASLKLAGWSETLEQMSIARQTRSLSPGAGGTLMFHLMALAEALRLRAGQLD